METNRIKIDIVGLIVLVTLLLPGCSGGGDGENGGTPTEPQVDTTPPVIESFTADKNEVETNENIKFNIKGYDNESPIIKIYIDSDKDDGLDYNYGIDVYGDSIDKNFEYAHSKAKKYTFTGKFENESGLFSDPYSLEINVKDPPSGGDPEPPPEPPPEDTEPPPAPPGYRLLYFFCSR